jgi:hypothetical protein
LQVRDSTIAIVFASLARRESVDHPVFPAAVKWIGGKVLSADSDDEAVRVTRGRLRRDRHSSISAWSTGEGRGFCCGLNMRTHRLDFPHRTVAQHGDDYRSAHYDARLTRPNRKWPSFTANHGSDQSF